ncbi:MAG TPA: Hpt domain-containing protein [Azospirillum sp.]|nr:Hpt domain-containing protein [Azospirillum sp.]
MPTATTTGSLTEIDPEILDVEPMVRNFGGLTALVNNLYTLFLNNEEQLHIDLTARLASGDLHAARIAAHAAAGAARTAGARRLAALCSTIEDALARGDAGAATREAACLATAIADVRRMIAQI